MKCLLIFIAFLCCEELFAQHTSNDFKDGAGCGPFPLYVSTGFITSGYSDFYDVQKDFNDTYFSDQELKRRVNGVSIAVGSPIVWTDYPFMLSPVLEAKYVLLTRNARTGDQSMSFFSNQLFVGGGLRYTFFPLVIQAQYQRVLLAKHDYRFKSPSGTSLYSYGSKGNSYLLRLSLLDPAGSDGGFGVFFEYNWIFMKNDRGDHLNSVIRTFDPEFEGGLRSNERYRYFSVGLIVPLALRIK